MNNFTKSNENKNERKEINIDINIDFLLQNESFDFGYDQKTLKNDDENKSILLPESNDPIFNFEEFNKFQERPNENEFEITNHKYDLDFNIDSLKHKNPFDDNDIVSVDDILINKNTDEKNINYFEQDSKNSFFDSLNDNEIFKSPTSKLNIFEQFEEENLNKNKFHMNKEQFISKSYISNEIDLNYEIPKEINFDKNFYISKKNKVDNLKEESLPEIIDKNYKKEFIYENIDENPNGIKQEYNHDVQIMNPIYLDEKIEQKNNNLNIDNLINEINVISEDEYLEIINNDDINNIGENHEKYKDINDNLNNFSLSENNILNELDTNDFSQIDYSNIDNPFNKIDLNDDEESFVEFEFNDDVLDNNNNASNEYEIIESKINSTTKKLIDEINYKDYQNANIENNKIIDEFNSDSNIVNIIDSKSVIENEININNVDNSSELIQKSDVLKSIESVFSKLKEKNKKLNDELNIFLKEIDNEKLILESKQKEIINRKEKMKEILSNEYTKSIDTANIEKRKWR